MTQTHLRYILIFRGLVQNAGGLSQFPALEIDSIFSEAISSQRAVKTRLWGSTSKPIGPPILPGIAGSKIELRRNKTSMEKSNNSFCVCSPRRLSQSSHSQWIHLHSIVEQQKMKMGVLLNIGCAKPGFVSTNNRGDSKDRTIAYTLLLLSWPPVTTYLTFHFVSFCYLGEPIFYLIYTSFLSLDFECSFTFFWKMGQWEALVSL